MEVAQGDGGGPRGWDGGGWRWPEGIEMAQGDRDGSRGKRWLKGMEEGEEVGGRGIYSGEMGMPRLSGFGRQEMIGLVISHAAGGGQREVVSG